MIHSMTAFARHEQVEPFGTLTWELRSVNHRYLEPSFKMPDLARASEQVLRDTLRKALARGKVECSLRFEAAPQTAAGVSINQELLSSLLQANAQIAKQLGNCQPEQASTFLQWPGVLESSSIDSTRMQQAIQEGFSAAIAQLLANRAREGVELKKLILQRIENINSVIQFITPLIPQAIAKQKQKLLDRFAEMQIGDVERLEQELLILAQKVDIDEELDRLQAHLKEVKNTLEKGSPCGRRLDFLMQELNREANTLGSKSILSDTSQAAVDLKVYIEQMREQIQNIE